MKLLLENTEAFNYFSSHRIKAQNAIIGVWISFVFGFISILTADEMTRTLLAVLAFTLIIVNVTAFFYLKHYLYSVWEKRARTETIKEKDWDRFHSDELPTNEHLSYWQRIIRLVIPRTIHELLIQSVIWTFFLMLFIFWEPISPDQDHYVIKKVVTWFIHSLPGDLANFQKDFFGFGTLGIRHIIFLMTMLICLLANLLFRVKLIFGFLMSTGKSIQNYLSDNN